MKIGLAWPSGNLEMRPSKASEAPKQPFTIAGNHQECEFDQPIRLVKDIPKVISSGFFPALQKVPEGDTYYRPDMGHRVISRQMCTY